MRAYLSRGPGAVVTRCWRSKLPLFCGEGGTCSIWKFPGKGSNGSCSSRPQPRGIQAASVTHATAHGNAGPNPVSEARDPTHTLTDTRWIRYCCTTAATPELPCLTLQSSARGASKTVRWDGGLWLGSAPGMWQSGRGPVVRVDPRGHVDFLQGRWGGCGRPELPSVASKGPGLSPGHSRALRGPLTLGPVVPCEFRKGILITHNPLAGETLGRFQICWQPGWNDPVPARVPPGRDGLAQAALPPPLTPLAPQGAGGAARHPLQHDAALLLRPGRGLRRGGGDAHLPLRGPHPRLARGQHGPEVLRAPGGPRREERHQDLQLLQEVRLQDHRHGRLLPQHGRDQGPGGLRLPHHLAPAPGGAAQRHQQVGAHALGQGGPGQPPGEGPPGREGLPLAAQRGPHGCGEAVGRDPQVCRRRREAGADADGTNVQHRERQIARRPGGSAELRRRRGAGL
uniref:Transaldolase n=1 Tax=Sus scrofa TaxID=9823 RepID=A0A480IKI3_PIG